MGGLQSSEGSGTKDELKIEDARSSAGRRQREPKAGGFLAEAQCWKKTASGAPCLV